MVNLGFRGMRWQSMPLELGSEFATIAHNCYRRNNTLEPIRRGTKSTTKSTVDFKFARSFYRHHDKIVASGDRVDFGHSLAVRDKSNRMFFVYNNLYQHLPNHEIAENYPSNLNNGHRVGVPAPLNYGVGLDGERGGLYVHAKIRADANRDSTDGSTIVRFDDLPEGEKINYIESSFLFTYVNKYGEEGPPSLPCKTFMARPNETQILVTSIRYSSNPDVIGIRLYMLVGGDYFLVSEPSFDKPESTYTAEIPNLTFLNDVNGSEVPFVDILFAPEATTGQMISLDWDQAPTGMKHLAQLDNGMIVLADDNTLYLNEPYQMHAFPVQYRQPVPGTIQRIVRINGGCAVLTDRGVHLFVGNTPENFQELPQNFEYPITDPDSLTTIDDAHVYVCSEGIAMMTSAGGQIITDGWIDIEEWQSHVTLDQCKCALYEGRILLATRNPSNNNPIGYMFNLRTQEITSFDLDEDAMKAGFWRDSMKGETLYVSDSTGLSIFNRGNRQVAIWESGDIVIPRAVQYVAALCESDDYPAGNLTIKPDQQAHFVASLSNNRPFRIKPTGRARRMRVRVETGKSIIALPIAESMRQL